jgi:hypothetical protein
MPKYVLYYVCDQSQTMSSLISILLAHNDREAAYKHNQRRSVAEGGYEDAIVDLGRYEISEGTSTMRKRDGH